MIGVDLSGVYVLEACARAVVKIESLFSACLGKHILFHDLNHCPLFWETISQEFDCYFSLSTEEIREAVGAFAQAGHTFRGITLPTSLNSRVEELISVVQQTES